jgi:hypothetical protein
MSWDMMIFKPSDPPIPIDEIPDDYQFPLMGTASEVRTGISTYLPGVDWADPAWGIYTGDGFSIELNIGPEEMIGSIGLHVRGGGIRLRTSCASSSLMAGLHWTTAPQTI